jgi:hypothetical protein
MKSATNRSQPLFVWSMPNREPDFVFDVHANDSNAGTATLRTPEWDRGLPNGSRVFSVAVFGCGRALRFLRWSSPDSARRFSS